MNIKKRTLVAIICLIVFFVASTITLAVVLVASNFKATTSMKIKYTATNVDVTASATYYKFNNISHTIEGSGTEMGECNLNTSNKTGQLPVIDEILLEEDNSLIFAYFFENNTVSNYVPSADVYIDLNILNADGDYNTSPEMDNLKFEYYVQHEPTTTTVDLAKIASDVFKYDTKYSRSGYMSYISASEQGALPELPTVCLPASINEGRVIVFIKVSVVDKRADAIFNGTLEWNLTRDTVSRSLTNALNANDIVIEADDDGARTQVYSSGHDGIISYTLGQNEVYKKSIVTFGNKENIATTVATDRYNAGKGVSSGAPDKLYRKINSITITGPEDMSASIDGFNLQIDTNHLVDSVRLDSVNKDYYYHSYYDIGEITISNVKFTDTVTFGALNHERIKIGTINLVNCIFDFTGQDMGNAAVQFNFNDGDATTEIDDIGAINLSRCSFINITGNQTKGVQINTKNTTNNCAIAIEECGFNNISYNAINVGGTGGKFAGKLVIAGKYGEGSRNNTFDTTGNRAIRIADIDGAVLRICKNFFIDSYENNNETWEFVKITYNTAPVILDDGGDESDLSAIHTMNYSRWRSYYEWQATTLVNNNDGTYIWTN